MKNLQRNSFWDKIIWYITIVVLNDPEEKINKRTMMVLYRSPEQTDFAYLLLKIQPSSLL